MMKTIAKAKGKVPTVGKVSMRVKEDKDGNRVEKVTIRKDGKKEVMKKKTKC